MLPMTYHVTSVNPLLTLDAHHWLSCPGVPELEGLIPAAGHQALITEIQSLIQGKSCISSSYLLLQVLRKTQKYGSKNLGLYIHKLRFV